MASVAFYTIGLLRQPLGSASIAPYEMLTVELFERMAKAPGFVRRIEDEVSARPRCAREEDALPVSTLSLWRDLESVFLFSYVGVHADALRRRREWLVATEKPAYVAWWMHEDRDPSWTEAVDRYEQLIEQGASPEAFDFHTAFDASGNRVRVRRLRHE